MKIYLSIFFAVVLWGLSPHFTHAYDLKVSPDVSVSENYVSESNLYIASLHTWFNSNYQKDIVSVSLAQTVGGTVSGDTTLFGKDINIISDSSGDVRAIGDTVYINGSTHKDLIIVARHVILGPNSSISGDTLILANTTELQGQISGKTQITSNKILISGSIAGQAALTASKIIFNSGSKVLSDISYFSPQKAIIAFGTDIQGQLNFNQIESIKQNDVIKRIFFGFVSFWAVIKLIATLFVVFILTHLFRVPVQRILEGLQYRKIQVFFIGIASLIGAPVLSIVLFGSLVLIPVAIIVSCIFLIMIMLLPALSSIISAYIYQKYIQKQNKININFKVAAIMVVILTLVGFVPYAGNILVYGLYVFSFGALTRYLYDMIRRRKINF